MLIVMVICNLMICFLALVGMTMPTLGVLNTRLGPWPQIPGAAFIFVSETGEINILLLPYNERGGDSHVVDHRGG